MLCELSAQDAAAALQHKIDCRKERQASVRGWIAIGVLATILLAFVAATVVLIVLVINGDADPLELLELTRGRLP